MIISLKNFKGQLHKIASVLVKTSAGETLYMARAKHDIQPMGAQRRSLNKPQDKPFGKRMTRMNISMSHLEDRKMTRAHLR